jgi:two-component system sensor histidine kinase QseC
MRFVKAIRLNSLSFKVLLAYLAGTMLSIALLVVAAVVMVQSRNLAQMDLAGLAEDMAERIRFDSNGIPVGLEADEDDLAWVFDSLRRETAYRVLDQAGNAALLSPAGETLWPTGEGLSHPARGRFEFEHDGVVLYGATEPVENGGRTWYFQVAASARLMTLLHRVALPLVGVGVTVFGLVLLLAFGLCAYITLRYTLKPLRDVSESAAAIFPRSMHARLKTEAVPAEIAPLVDSFNRVLERLEQGYRVQQEFLGNAAHELKTPLALIRAQIELKEDGAGDGDSLLGDVEYMTRQVQQLLLLAEASEVRNYKLANVRLQEIADEAAAYLQRMAETAGVQLVVSAAAEGVAWEADRGALFTLLKNLLENAIQHAPAKTPVRVEIQRDALIVRDLGPGVDAVQLPLLFERFWRGAHRRDHGAGLGLAICHEIAVAHGWRLTAERAEPGLRFKLSNGKAANASPR